MLSGAVAFPFATSGVVSIVAPADPTPASPSPALDPGAGTDLANDALANVPNLSSAVDPEGPRTTLAPVDGVEDLRAAVPPADEPIAPDMSDADPAADAARPSKKNALTGDLPALGCLSRTICAIKERIRWQTPGWTPTQCTKIAGAVLASARRYSISPSLLLAVMINESDLNEKSARITMRDSKVYAKDSGLMAIRCVLDRRNHCLNGNVRGLAWADVMNPVTNIALGARELAYWRSGGAVTKVVVKVRDASGRMRPVFKNVPCRHKDHAYWAHYNHGPYYIAKGYPRHYPHRVAVIDHALANVLNVDAPELRGTHLTVHDPGKRERTADRPLEARYRKLCSQIQSVGACSAVALN